jgi:virulence factor Mce-like protein
MRRSTLAPAVGLATVAAVVAVIALASHQFRGGFSDSVAITLLSNRAGLVMNPDARVALYGAQVGKVSSIESLPDGRAAIHLAIDPAQLDLIPSNVRADISATTIFGAKYVQLIPPDDPSDDALRPGQVLTADHVTVEPNTLFAQLTSVLDRIEPEKLNQTLGAISAAFNGRGEQIGRALTDLNAFLGALEPHLPALRHDLEVAPTVFAAYADAAPDLLRIADAASIISDTIVDEQTALDATLLSAIGLADIGTPVLDDNRQALADVIHLLVPTTALTYEYRAALWCGIAGLLANANAKPVQVAGVPVNAGLVWGADRYRYPGDMSKVAASGGPQCTGLPKLPYQTVPPFVVTDTGTNPWKYNNPGVVLNADRLKRMLFGDLDGPPRNTAQVGQPG